MWGIQASAHELGWELYSSKIEWVPPYKGYEKIESAKPLAGIPVAACYLQ